MICWSVAWLAMLFLTLSGCMLCVPGCECCSWGHTTGLWCQRVLWGWASEWVCGCCWWSRWTRWGVGEVAWEQGGEWVSQGQLQLREHLCEHRQSAPGTWKILSSCVGVSGCDGPAKSGAVTLGACVSWCQQLGRLGSRSSYWADWVFEPSCGRHAPCTSVCKYSH